ncbi:hypothetical protein EYF80_020878 [Liparis tanakae]|uniref:Uncharacterized protein n=1 Tax=Liparis tanakae TaxID=230148 RepID=A0A4Z2HV54_9TELE|nr:hypothetical protein EYF80_020878 [Liparis tanakae]
MHCSSPPAMMVMRSPSRSASSMKCVVSRMVRPRFSPCRRSQVARRADGSIPDVGSSNITTWRSITLERGSWSEPDACPQGWSEHLSVEEQVLSDGEVIEQHVVLGAEAQAAADQSHVLTDVVTVDVGSATECVTASHNRNLKTHETYQYEEVGGKRHSVLSREHGLHVPGHQPVEHRVKQQQAQHLGHGEVIVHRHRVKQVRPLDSRPCRGARDEMHIKKHAHTSREEGTDHEAEVDGGHSEDEQEDKDQRGVTVGQHCSIRFDLKENRLTWIQRSRVTKKMEMERKRKNRRNQALQWSQLLRPIILMYS